MRNLKSVLIAGSLLSIALLWYTFTSQSRLLSENQLQDSKQDGLRYPEYFQPHRLNSAGKPSPAAWYCNFPSATDAQNAEEGKPPKSNWILKQVQVVIRHGDRSPITNALYRKLGVEAKYCNLNPDSQPYHPSLEKFVKSMSYDYARIRMNGRVFFSPPFPNEKQCGDAELSQLGVVQHIHQGEILRKIYIEDHGLLSAKLSTAFDSRDLSSAVYVVTTQRSRTVQSAVAFLYGLLPDFHLDQIHFKYSRSDLFRAETCPLASVMQDQISSVRSDIYSKRQSRNNTFRKLADTFLLSDHSGVLIDSLVTGFLCKNIKLPCLGPKCVTVDDLDVLMEEEKYMLRQMSELTQFDNQSMLVIQPLLAKIANLMSEKTTNKTSSPDIVLFSGHDSTLKPLIRALAIPEYRWPRLGSRLVFELWYDQIGNEHYVRILLNGKDHTSHLKFCQNGQGQQTRPHCAFRDMYFYITHGIQKHFGADSIREACVKH